jgi:hypothetical protein
MPDDKTLAEKVDAWMAEHDPACVACGKSQWETTKEFFWLPTGDPTKIGMEQARKTYWIIFTCGSCGYSFLVAPKAMGITD